MEKKKIVLKLLIEIFLASKDNRLLYRKRIFKKKALWIPIKKKVLNLIALIKTDT